MAKNKDTTLYAMLGLIIVLLLISITIQLQQRQDSLTSWATIQAQELHTFMEQCKAGDGTFDVRPNAAPDIVFICQYEDRTVEHTLAKNGPKR